MTAVVCIEVDYKNELLAAKEFPELEKEFASKTNGTMVKMAKPNILRNKSKVIVEFDLMHKTLARMMLPIIKSQTCKQLVEKLKTEGYDIDAKCYLKKEVK